MKPSHLLSVVSQVCLPRRKPDAQLFLNLPLKKIYFMFMDVLYVSMCTTCRPGAAHRDQKRKSESQKQELRIASRHHLGAGKVSLTAGPTFSPNDQYKGRRGNKTKKQNLQ